MLRLTPSIWLPPTLDTLVMASGTLDTHTLLPTDMETLVMLDLAMETLAMLDLPMEILAILVLGIWEPEVTMARGMLMLTRRFWLPPTLATPMPVMASVTLVIPILLPMDMETLAMLDLAMPAMLVLDSAMDIPTLPLLEPAEIILELLSHAKFEQLLLPVCYHLFLIKVHHSLREVSD